MKKIWNRALIVLIIVIAVSAGVAALITTKPDLPGVASSQKGKGAPKMFQLVKDEKILRPAPKIRTQSAIVVDLGSGNIILSKNEESVRSIASLTKLATALVYLSTKPDMQMIDTVTAQDKAGAGRSRLRTGAQARLHDIFHLMLICSDNVAARIVARSTGLDSTQFVAKMNKMAQILNLTHTHFADPTGLDAGNVSTAAEIAILFKTALDQPFISEVVAKKEYSFRPINSKRMIAIHNTNHMLYGRQDIIGGKTGFINESGYCLALGINNSDGKKMAAVLLGAPSSGSRFRDAARIIASLAPPKIIKPKRASF
jgi:serine-type D-Ala-D-Ala endopeptidase (penicillin-binding protein 7)